MAGTVRRRIVQQQGPVTITNCTFAQNTTAGGAPGPRDTYGAAGMATRRRGRVSPAEVWACVTAS